MVDGGSPDTEDPHGRERRGMLQFGVLGLLTVERGGMLLALPAGRARVTLGALIVSPGAGLSMDERVTDCGVRRRRGPR